MKGLQRKLFRDFRSLYSQVLTIAILVICGVSVLVSSWSSYESLESSKLKYYTRYHFADVFAELVRAPSSVLENISKLQGVEIAESRIIKEGLVEVGNQTEPALGRFISWNSSAQALNLIYLRQGRMPQVSAAIEVVVHEAFANAHNLKPGQSIQVLLGGKKVKLSISGIGISPEYVYALSPIAPLPDDKHFGVFWLRRSDMEFLTGMSGAFNSVQLKVSKDASIPKLKIELDEILKPNGGMVSYDRLRQQSNIFVEDEIRQQKVMALVMPSIFLAVAAFILNIFFNRMITLHRGQIASLKALGYSSWKLTFHYFQLVSLILLIGIIPSLYCGHLIGQWYAKLYKDFFRFPEIEFSLSGQSVFLGILAGLLPGWLGSISALVKVFSMQPAEALRPPSPPNFQKGIFEKINIFTNISLGSKMILRSLLFRPFRLFLSIMGMAAALAVLINGSFWTDIIDFMMDRQFYEMRREDLTVRLRHPKDINVISDFKNLNGVLIVESERTVPVRLQHKNLKKETKILGWEKSNKLSRILDKDGKIIEPKIGGALLSRYFETELGIRNGESILLTVLEGKQSQIRLKVMGFVDDLIGQQIYVTKSDLHFWLGEKNVSDTIQLRVDSREMQSIYLKLKERPEVASINVRRLLISSFSETIANMIVTFTFILFAFAVAIAGAVIYNASRISLSERAWELASLRILGFETYATFEILFIDIGFQVILSIIPGVGLGYLLSYLSTNFIHNDTFKFPLVIDLSTYGIAIIILLVTFFLSSILLFRQVKKINFSEALKARE